MHFRLAHSRHAYDNPPKGTPLTKLRQMGQGRCKLHGYGEAEVSAMATDAGEFKRAPHRMGTEEVIIPVSVNRDGPDKGGHTMRKRRQFAQLIGLTVAIGFVLALTVYKAEQNAARRARFRERDLKQQAAIELGQEVAKRIEMALKAGLTLSGFTEAFGPPAELHEATDQKHAGVTHSLFHKESQRTFYLQFRDGRLMGVHSGQGFGDVDTGIVLETPPFLRSESIRTWVLLGGFVAWWVILVVGIRVQRFRRRASILLATTALVCGLCWFLAPNYSPTLRGVSSNDHLAIFALLLVASLGFGMTGGPRREDAGAMDRLHGSLTH